MLLLRAVQEVAIIPSIIVTQSWQSGGERWERRRGRIERPERVAAVGEGRRRTVAEDIRRAPQQDHMQA